MRRCSEEKERAGGAGVVPVGMNSPSSLAS